MCVGTGPAVLGGGLRWDGPGCTCKWTGELLYWGEGELCAVELFEGLGAFGMDRGEGAILEGSGSGFGVEEAAALGEGSVPGEEGEAGAAEIVDIGEAELERFVLGKGFACGGAAAGGTRWLAPLGER